MGAGKRLLVVADGEPHKYVVELTQAIGDLRLIEGEAKNKPISDAHLIDSFAAEIDGTETIAFKVKCQLTFHSSERSRTLQRAVELGQLSAKPIEFSDLKSSAKRPAKPTRDDGNVYLKPIVIVVLADRLLPLVARDVDFQALVMRTTK